MIERIVELLNKKYAREITLLEQRELQNLLETEENGEILKDKIERFYQLHPKYANTLDDDLLSKVKIRLYQRISERSESFVVQRSKVFPIWVRIVSIAALFIIVIGAFIYFQGAFNEDSSKSPNIVITKKGSKSSVTLPDGTKVWINSDSKLSYDESFGKNTRDVRLEGEAFFDVKKDTKHPFIVHTQTMDIKVLGTIFNVRSYESEENAQATLIKGLVEVNLKKQNNQKITLRPNEKIIVQDKQSGLNTDSRRNDKQPDISFIKVELESSDSAVLETGWVNNKLVFRQNKLEEIVAIIERWYNVDVEVERRPKIKSFSGTFENDNISDVMEALRLASGLNYKIDKNRIIIY